MTRNASQATAGESDRGREHAELGLLEQRPLEGERRDEQRDGEADAGRRGGDDERGPRDRQPRAAEHRARREPRRAQDPERLADHVRGDDAERHRRGRRRRQHVAVELDAGVGEREERHDHPARPRVQAVLQPLVGRDRRGEARARRVGQLRRRLLAERARELGAALEVLARRRVGARDQADGEARRSPRRRPTRTSRARSRRPRAPRPARARSRPSAAPRARRRARSRPPAR